MNEKQVDTIRTVWLFIVAILLFLIPVKFVLSLISTIELLVLSVIFSVGFILVFGKDCWIESTVKKKSDFYMMNGKLKRFEQNGI